MTIDFLVKNFIEIRNQAHLWHWQTELYSEHKALNAFYDQWTDLMDTFVETFSGRYFRPSAGFTCSALPYQVGLSQPYLMRVSELLKSNEVRSVATDSDLQNILDEMTSLANQTAYMLSLK